MFFLSTVSLALPPQGKKESMLIGMMNRKFHGVSLSREQGHGKGKSSGPILLSLFLCFLDIAACSPRGGRW